MMKTILRRVPGSRFLGEVIVRRSRRRCCYRGRERKRRKERERRREREGKRERGREKEIKKEREGLR